MDVVRSFILRCLRDSDEGSHGLGLPSLERRWRKGEAMRSRCAGAATSSVPGGGSGGGGPRPCPSLRKIKQKLQQALQELEREGVVRRQQASWKREYGGDVWKIVDESGATAVGGACAEAEGKVPPDDGGGVVSGDRRGTAVSLDADAIAGLPETGTPGGGTDDGSGKGTAGRGWSKLRAAFDSSDHRGQDLVAKALNYWNEVVDWSQVPAERARKWVYSPSTMAWDSEVEIQVKIHPASFARGAMRQCFRMKKVDPRFAGQSWEKASPYVAKSYLDPAVAAVGGGDVYKDDVVLQLECAAWADKYNKRHPPKPLEFVFVWLVELVDRPGSPLFHVERFIEGEYIKVRKGKV